MSDDPKHRGREQGARVATIGEHELGLFVDRMKAFFPAKDTAQIEAALELGLEETHCAATREVLAEKVVAILRRD